MNPTDLRLSIALAGSVPGAALRISAREGGAFFASDHPAGELRIDDLRATVLAGDLDGAVRLEDIISDAEIGGSLVAMGGGLYLEDGAPVTVLWSVVGMSPIEIDAALDAVDCPEFADDIEVLLRTDPELAATAIRVGAERGAEDEVDEDALLDVAMHILGACLAAEVERAANRSRH